MYFSRVYFSRFKNQNNHSYYEPVPWGLKFLCPGDCVRSGCKTALPTPMYCIHIFILAANIWRRVNNMSNTARVTQPSARPTWPFFWIPGARANISAQLRKKCLELPPRQITRPAKAQASLSHAAILCDCCIDLNTSAACSINACKSAA